MDVKLVMFRENGEERTFPIGKGVTTVGRKEDCGIRIPVAEVSRRHAEFRAVEDGVVLKDMASANGTFVNNKRITMHKLAPGDHIVFGPVVFTVQIDGQPADIKPVKTKLRTKAASAKTDDSGSISDDELDPISALEALASSADQTALDPFDDEDDDI